MYEPNDWQGFADDWQEFKRGNLWAAFPTLFYLTILGLPLTILTDELLYRYIEQPEWHRFVTERNEEMDIQTQAAWRREHGENGVYINGAVYAQRHADADGDGFTIEAGDCNDYWPEVSPDAIEVCNHVDDDCDFQADEGLAECDFGWRMLQRFKVVSRLVVQ
jgi:hypothetical protein